MASGAYYKPWVVASRQVAIIPLQGQGTDRLVQHSACRWGQQVLRDPGECGEACVLPGGRLRMHMNGQLFLHEHLRKAHEVP